MNKKNARLTEAKPSAQRQAHSIPDVIRNVIPAAPGYWVLTPVQEEDGSVLEASHEPIIAWSLQESGCVYPVTAFDGLHYEGAPPVLCPDGVVRAWTGEWANENAWLSEQRKIAARRLV